MAHLLILFLAYAIYVWSQSHVCNTDMPCQCFVHFIYASPIEPVMSLLLLTDNGLLFLWIARYYIILYGAGSNYNLVHLVFDHDCEGLRDGEVYGVQTFGNTADDPCAYKTYFLCFSMFEILIEMNFDD